MPDDTCSDMRIVRSIQLMTRIARLAGFHLQHAGLHQYAREIEDVADALDRAIGDDEFRGTRHFDPCARACDAEEGAVRGAGELPENGGAAVATMGGPRVS